MSDAPNIPLLPPAPLPAPPPPQRYAPFAAALAEPILVRSCALIAAIQVGLCTLHLPAWPCAFYHLTGLPCPGCGLTRSCTSLLRGHPLDALRYHLFGPLLFLGIVLLLVGSLLPRRHLLRLSEFIARFERSSRFTTLLMIAFCLYWPLRLAGVFPLPA